MDRGGGYAVGIDLGTSNTVAILRWPDGRTRPVLFDGQPVLPSAVFLDHNGTLQIGRDAQRMAQLDPARFEPNPKRRIDEDVLLLGDRELPIAEVLAAPLRAIARAVTDTVGHLPPAVITCPAAWGNARRGRLQEAATRAGWPPVHLLAEPIAAARYFTETLQRPVPPGATLAIFDFGGGTLDVALVRNDGATFTVVGSGGAEDLGGLDIDAAIVTHLGQVLATRHPEVWAQISQPADELARRNRRMFWDDVRAAKEMLSRSTSAPIAVPGVSSSLHLTRDELEYLATPLLRRATGELTRAMRQSGLGPDRLSGIFLVGGASRVPLVSRLLHAETGIAPTVLEQPELPVAEGAVAGRGGPAGPGGQAQPAAQRSAPVSAPTGTPVSGLPVSGTPSSGGPVSGPPVGAVSGAPASPMGVNRGPGGFAPAASGGFAPAPAASGGFAPAAAPMIYTTLPPQRPMPGTPLWAPPAPVAGRPPRRYRAWPWILSVFLVIGLLCTGAYYVVKPDDPGEPLVALRTVTIANLAPAGLRQTIVTDKLLYAIGQRADGKVEVLTHDIATGAEVRHESTVSGAWTHARRVGDWIAVFSVPLADGSRRVALSNGVDNEQQTIVLNKGDELTFHGVVYPNDDLGYLVYSPTTGTVRTGTIGGQTNSQSRAVALPAGARLMSDLRFEQDELVFMDGTGAIWRYDGGDSLRSTTVKAPPGFPLALVHYYDGSHTLYVAENKAEYQVLRSGSLVVRGPAGRQPVWIGACGYGLDEVCVVDQRPNDPASREIMVVTTTSSSGLYQRAAVPHAAVPGPVTGVSQSLYNYLLVPTLEGEKVGTVTVDSVNGRSRTYAGDLRLAGGVGGVLLPNRPAGAAADWVATPQPVDLAVVNLSNGEQSAAGSLTVRLASCDFGAGHMSCGRPDDFQIWKVTAPT